MSAIIAIVHVDIVGPLIKQRKEIEALGWDVHVLDGLDHTLAMQSANVVPIVHSWLDSKLICKAPGEWSVTAGNPEFESQCTSYDCNKVKNGPHMRSILFLFS